jgi:signal transduction histidine kinase
MKGRGAEVLAVTHALAGAPFDCSPDMFRTAMNQALARLGKVFHFKSTALVSINPQDWSIEGVFGAQGQEAETPLVQDFVSDLRVRTSCFSDPAPFRGSERETSFCQARRILLKQGSRAIASFVKQHDRLALMLVVECRALHWKTLEDAQILRQATELLALAIEKQMRSIELRELTQHLEEAQRAHLAGGVAHELNNNLTAIMGYAEMAAEAVLPDPLIHAYIEEILDAGKRAKLVIDQILTPGRIWKNAATPFNAVEATATILPALRMCITASVRLCVDLPDAALMMVGSPIEFQQTLIGLCKGAGKAAGGAGQLRLAIEAVEQRADRSLSHGQLHPRKYVRISIINMGGEIAEPSLKTTVDGGGSAPVSLKGAMHLSSSHGKGRHLELYFPCVDEQAISFNNRFVASGHRPGKGELVAIVDPDGASRSMWEERVAALGYEPLGFSEVLALVDWCLHYKSEPDVVLFNTDDHGWAADAGEMEKGLSAEAAWMYVSDGFPRRPEKPRVIEQPNLLGKPVI